MSDSNHSSAASVPWTTRFLRLAGDVSVDETRDVLVMFLNIFMLLIAYYILKTVREPLILASGAQLKSYAAAAQAAVLLVYVPLYGTLAARLPVDNLVTRVNLAVVVCIQ